MLRLSFNESITSVLCLGAHCDDIEIGCGGTIMRLAEGNSKIIFHWVIFSSDQQRAKEAVESAQVFLENVPTKYIIIKDYRDGFFPFCGAEIKEYFEQLKQEVSPDLVFTHSRNDLHQDHRLVSDLTRNTFRDHLILEYEIPKYDGDLGRPNCFFHLDESTCSRKIQIIMSTFKTQRNKHWFTEDTFWSLLRIRGIESHAPTKYAEAFYCRKIVF